jgi:hypothetical protein
VPMKKMPNVESFIDLVFRFHGSPRLKTTKYLAHLPTSDLYEYGTITLPVEEKKST